MKAKAWMTTILILILLLLLGTITLGNADNNFFSTSSSEGKETESLFVYEVLPDGTIAVTDYLGKDTSIIIPSEINGQTVTMIKWGGFIGKSHYESASQITIPSTVTTIGENAFWGCENLVSINIPNTVTSLGAYAFYNCFSLAAISIPNSITTIENGTFSNCTSLTNIIIPDNIMTIGNSAFNECTNLNSVVISSSVTSIGSYAFYHNDRLSSISVPESVTTIGTSAFGYCNSLQEIYVAPRNSIYASIDGVLFDKTTRTLLQYPIGKSDKEYSVPQGIRHIGDYAFSRCLPLQSVIIPDSVEEIGQSAFDRCTNLEEVVIPESVIRIKAFAFSSSGLKKIVIPDGTIQIEIMAFSGCENLTTAIIADSVAEIEESLFSFCTNLSEVKLSNNLKKLDRTFNYCINLKHIIIPDGIEYLNQTFMNCTALTDVSLPNGLLEIGEHTFESCTALESLQLPSGLRYIGKCAFESCTALQQMDFTQSPALLTIDEKAFSGCTALTEIILPDNLVTLGDMAFTDCSTLKTVKWTTVPIPETLMTEGEINYLPSTDRKAMIRMMARHFTHEQGYTVLPEVDGYGNLTDKESWREEKINALKDILAEQSANLSKVQAEIDNPETTEGKQTVLERRLDSIQRNIKETEASITHYKSMKLLVDSEAQKLWETNTGINDTKAYGYAIYDLWQQTYMAMKNGTGIPEGYSTLNAYLTAEDGLRLTNHDIMVLDQITRNFEISGNGTISYISKINPAIYHGAFVKCMALEKIIIPASITSIDDSLFIYGPSTVMVIVEPNSFAEQYCINNGIHYSFTQEADWLNP